jgi:hypothetical protein
MASYCAVCGDCANTSPPPPFTARTPSVPSLPVPETMMATARSLLFLCQRPRESVYRHAQAMHQNRFTQFQCFRFYRQIRVWRNDTDVIGFNARAVHHL